LYRSVDDGFREGNVKENEGISGEARSFPRAC